MKSTVFVVLVSWFLSQSSVEGLLQQLVSSRKLRACSKYLVAHSQRWLQRKYRTFFSDPIIRNMIVNFIMLFASFRMERRFWVAPRVEGFWEKDVLGTWVSHGAVFPDWEDNQYVETYRMTKHTFWYLCRRYGKLMKKQNTRIRCPVPFQKWLAIVIHWLAHDLSFSQLARMYCVGKSTALCIVHHGVSVLREHLVPESIRFPTGPELSQVIRDFEALCGPLAVVVL